MAFRGGSLTHFIRALRVRSDCSKEDAMKRRFACAVGIAVFLLIGATWVSAATMDGVVGDWVVYSKANGKVSKLGSDQSEGPARISFRAPQGSNTGTFTYNDPGGYIYTGDFVLSPDGKSLTMEFDAEGLDEFEAMMAHWLQTGASEKRLLLQNILFVYDEEGILIGSVKTSKKTNGPTKGTVSAKGVVWADVWDRGTYIGYIPGKFSYKSTTKAWFKDK